MLPLSQLLQQNVPFLMHSILEYSKKNQFTRYTSTLEEAWRLSIVGLNNSISQSLELPGLQFGPHQFDENHPLTRFGVEEAKRHRARGVTLYMFLALFKFYRQSYLDLVEKEISDKDVLRSYSQTIIRCFDLIELAFCSSWNESNRDETVCELQNMNRLMTNEKNAFLTIFESLEEPIITINYDSKIERINLAAAKLLNLQHTDPGSTHHSSDLVANSSLAKEAIGKPVREFFPWIPEEYLSIKGRERKSISFEVTLLVGGENKNFNALLSQMLDVSEKFTAIIVNLKDITELKHEKEKLEIANETKNKFFSIISHDLIAPFNIILGFCDILKEGYEDCTEEERLKFINNIYNTSVDALQLTKNILEWSRTQTGRLTPCFESHNIRLVLEEALSLLLKQAQKKSIQIDSDDVSYVQFWGDRAMVQTILRNLISNAIKFTHHSGKIVLSTELINGVLCVKIQDSGMGMSEDSVAKLFKIGEKNQMLGTAKEKGTGLGLLICAEFAKLNYAKIEVESKINEGSCFKLYLPTAKPG